MDTKSDCSKVKAVTNKYTVVQLFQTNLEKQHTRGICDGKGGIQYIVEGRLMSK